MCAAPKKNLYKELSLSCGIADDYSSMRFYYGMVKYIIDELKKNGEISLPDLGTFKLKKHKAAKYFNVNKQQMDVSEEFKRVSFIPSKKMKNYFKKLR